MKNGKILYVFLSVVIVIGFIWVMPPYKYGLGDDFSCTMTTPTGECQVYMRSDAQWKIPLAKTANVLFPHLEQDEFEFNDPEHKPTDRHFTRRVSLFYGPNKCDNKIIIKEFEISDLTPSRLLFVVKGQTNSQENSVFVINKSSCFFVMNMLLDDTVKIPPNLEDIYEEKVDIWK